MRFLRLLSLLLLALVACPAAHAGEALVNDEVTVDVSGKDAADARDQAMAKAATDALTDLLNKLAPPEQVQDIVNSLDSKKIAAMVKGTEVMEEKIANDRYRATLLVSFDATAISDLVAKFTSATSKEDATNTTSAFLIIPAYEDDGEQLLWEDKNPWLRAWKTLGIELTTGDIVVPYGDSNDGATVDVKNIASSTYASLAPLAIRYGISDIVTLQATYTKSPDMTLTVIKRRINRLHNEVNMLTYRADPQETRDTLLARAAKDIADNLRNKKNEEIATSKGVQGGERNKVMILASVSTLASWTQLKAKLVTLPMIDKLDTIAVSSQQVDMVVYYRGAPEELATAITGLQLRLVKNQDYWVVSRD
jgi:hypothetical protein